MAVAVVAVVAAAAAVVVEDLQQPCPPSQYPAMLTPFPLPIYLTSRAA